MAEPRVIISRFLAEPTYTLGVLTLDGSPCCFTLEDTVREVPGAPVETWKIARATAIPVGMYDLVIDLSIRFGRLMPHLLEVPGFTGIRFHAGHTVTDTEGCPLLGDGLHLGRIDGGSTVMAFARFMAWLEQATPTRCLIRAGLSHSR